MDAPIDSHFQSQICKWNLTGGISLFRDFLSWVEMESIDKVVRLKSFRIRGFWRLFTVSRGQVKAELPHQERRLTLAKYHQALLMASHADATYDFKYGVRSVQGGGRSSARVTIGRVAAGAIAKKILKLYSGTECCTDVKMDINISNSRVPHFFCTNSTDIGTPVFDKLEAELAKACMSLPATKGFEIGSGFAGTFMTGSEHNDEFFMDQHDQIRTKTNRSGGVQGGISNGESINMRIAFKPTSTISELELEWSKDYAGIFLYVYFRMIRYKNGSSGLSLKPVCSSWLISFFHFRFLFLGTTQ
ncbi:chorismate synthase 2, chloroplastic-like [Lycium ferocissimum]|uniref:chorismate synthase 2, chloroplastic-like n=1 Tax=Lycium ferocissimum TaxID=112874 RepID=UPI002815CF8D|nr:chorismate synthase 2, chloroplastic-like [Lycium ferocissimum]